MALWNRILFPISNIWDHGDDNNGGQKDPTSFTAGGGVYEPGKTLALEGIDKSQDSLTQFIRSLNNYTGTEGKSTLERGQSTTQQGKDTFGPALDYWMKLLSGDEKAMADAVAPTARTIVSQYDAARKTVQQNNPRGGYRSMALAELPFKKASDIGTLFQELQPKAAGQVTEIAKILANLGISEQSLGADLLGLTQRGLFAMRGQDLSESASNKQMVAEFGKGIGSIIGALINR